ncbi:hypothetical protein [Nocardioides soli]|uniref:Uncharacterized protein n=1 Tax=Nocardioides soli TaxID=1036020 RepID=A0A7W4VSL3_9ACTN|nr:hypothetical protein [Nocardioides soli]MBB3041035.1 hypothetical protein [Nocardioides soli]
MPTPNPLAIVTFRGRRMDRKTATALAIAEQRLGYELTVTQGCYNTGGVSASAGTHDRGGVVDLAPYDHVHKVKVLRDLGFAAWYRPAIAGLWPAHIHAVMIGHQDLAPSAARQVPAYLAGRDGLTGNRLDANAYRPDVEPFDFAAAWRDGLLRQRIKGIKARRKTLADKASRLKSQITYRR